MYLVLLSDNQTTHARQAIMDLLADPSLQNKPVSVGYIASAPDPQRQYFTSTHQYLIELGVSSVLYAELEDDFNQQAIDDVLSADIIYLSGGDTYRFLYWLKQRKLLPTLQSLAVAGKPIIGVSAGAMILTYSIDSAILCGDENRIGLHQCDGLALVPWLFAPHIEYSAAQSAISEQSSVLFQQLVRLVAKHGRAIALCDDNVAISVTTAKTLLKKPCSTPQTSAVNHASSTISQQQTAKTDALYDDQAVTCYGTLAWFA